MSPWKRLKNLWALSSYEVQSSQEEDARNHKRIEQVRKILLKSNRMATIIEPQEYLDDIPTEPKDI